MYTNQEYVNMMLVLGFCEENCNEAARVYAARFADITHPSPGVFRRMMVRARETGSLIPTAGPDLGRPLEIVPEADELIIQLIQEDPTRSTRGIAQELGMSQTSITRRLKKEEFHPYHYTKVQALNNNDFGLRLNFCILVIGKN